MQAAAMRDRFMSALSSGVRRRVNVSGAELSQKIKSKGKNKNKGGGQECPSHTCASWFHFIFQRRS